MDPVVQVAIVSVFATLVTTAGVIAVAIINKKSSKEPEDNPLADLDVNDILAKLIQMAAENQRKESTIQKLRAQDGENKRRILFLEQFIDELKRGITHERPQRSPRAPERRYPREEPDPER